MNAPLAPPATAEARLADTLRLQRLLADISTRFITSPETETHEIIEAAQQMICEALGLDRSTLWLFSADDAEMALACYWQRPGSPPLRRNFVTRGNLPWADQQVRDGRSFRFSSLNELPPEAAKDREVLLRYGTKSNVTFPLATQGRVFGAVAFAMLNTERCWTDDEVASLGLIAQIFSHVISKRQAEDRVEQLRDEIQRSSRAAELGVLAAALAHEINQPLTTILTNAQAARRFIQQGSVEVREIISILDDIIRADKRAAEVLRDLRQMLGDKPIRREPLCLNELVTEACLLFANDPANEDIRLRFDPGALPVRLNLARVEIQQLLINLMTNASHAMRDAPVDRRRILIQTVCGDGMVHLRVRDEGQGIPPEHLDRIFEPFHTTRPDGLGMGLAICRRIAELHGGTLKAANHAAGGAEFTFSLPLGPAR